MKKIGKFIVALVIIAIAGASFVACKFGLPVRGKGETISTNYTIATYEGIKVSGNFEIVYNSGTSDKITISIQENLVEYIDVKVKNSILEIETSKNFIYNSGKKGVIYITAPTLKSISLSGAALMKDSDTIVGDKLNVSLSGAGNLEIAVDVETIEATISGAGSLTLTGNADTAIYKISGAGSISAQEVPSLDVTVNISGAGNCHVSCSDTLNANISGAGSIKYTGDPVVTKTVTGAGSVRKE